MTRWRGNACAGQCTLTRSTQPKEIFRVRKLVPWLSIILLMCAVRSVAQSPFAPKVSGPLSQRVVAYHIDAKYDPPQHTVEATETLTYHNLTGQPLDTFPFHL